jgi:hypothetical protein
MALVVGHNKLKHITDFQPNQGRERDGDANPI